MRIFLSFLLYCTLVFGFYTVKNQLYDSSGNRVRLRGVVRPSLEFMPSGDHLSLADYQHMKSWGANVVRLPLSQCYWLSNHVDYASGYANTLDTQVQQIKSLGMAVILDLHVSDGGNLVKKCVQQVMPDNNSLTFWKQVATKYKNDPMIMFEIYNEPIDVSWNVWLNGGDTGNNFTTPGMQSFYNTIRNTGANNTIVIGGLAWAYDLSGITGYAVNGFNIMYTTHIYEFNGKSPGEWPVAFGFLAESYPILVGEFGDKSCDSNFFYEKVINYTDQLNLHWTSWAWYPYGCTFPSIIADWDGTPTVAGAVVKASLGGKNISVPPPPSTLYHIYNDTVNAPWSDYSWASRNLKNTTFVHSGNYSISFSPSNYGAIYLFCPGCISPVSHLGIEFWINAGSGSSQKINFNLIQVVNSTNVKIGPDLPIVGYLDGGTLIANTWVRGYVDLRVFPTVPCDGMYFTDVSGTVQPEVYLDDIVAIPRNASVNNGGGGTTGNTVVSAANVVTYCYLLVTLAFFLLL